VTVRRNKVNGEQPGCVVKKRRRWRGREMIFV